MKILKHIVFIHKYFISSKCHLLAWEKKLIITNYQLSNTLIVYRKAQGCDVACQLTCMVNLGDVVGSVPVTCDKAYITLKEVT